MHELHRIRLAPNTRAILLSAAVVLVGLTGCSPLRGATNGPAPAASREQSVSVPDPNAAFREQVVQVQGKDLLLTGVLFTPAATPLMRERRPAIVLMHGCGGMVDSRGQLFARHRDWAERFARWGFVALVLDSFRPRGIQALCELKDRPISPWLERTADAYAALAWLAARKDVDPNEIFLLGWSHGGSTVMGVVRAEAPGRQAVGPRFRSAIAFYPGCTAPMQQRSYRPTLPVLILHGEADDWAPIAPCVALARKLGHNTPALRMVTYPDAHHGFDAPDSKVRLLPNAYNPRVPGGRGAHIGTNPQARAAAIEEVRRFIAHQLRK